MTGPLYRLGFPMKDLMHIDILEGENTVITHHYHRRRNANEHSTILIECPAPNNMASVLAACSIDFHCLLWGLKINSSYKKS